MRKTNCPFYDFFLKSFHSSTSLHGNIVVIQGNKYCQFVWYKKHDKTVTCASKKIDSFHILYWQRQEKNYNYTKVTITLNIYLAKILKRHSCLHALGILDAQTSPFQEINRSGRGHSLEESWMCSKKHRHEPKELHQGAKEMCFFFPTPVA